MTLLPLILILGICSSHWTTASPVRNAVYDLSNGTLKNVTAINARNTINLSNLHIKSIAANAFDTLLNVETLDLSNNDLTDLPPLIFSKLVKLKQLSLLNNYISSFDNNFIGLSNLKLLNIALNPIQSLKRGDFFGLTESVKIIIRSFILRRISSGIFKEPPKNRAMSMTTENKDYDFYHYRFKIRKINGILESIEHGQPSDPTTYKLYSYQPEPMIRLTDEKISGFKEKWYKVNNNFYTQINLCFNDIDRLSPELLNDLSPAIKRIDLSHNRITALKRNDHIKNLTLELDLGSNNISIIENGAFGQLNLLTLLLQKNSLSSVAFVRNLPTTIRILRLDDNLISQIPVETFYNLKNLEHLSIVRNKVKSIEPGTFKYHWKLKKIELMNNEISALKPGFFRGLYRLEHIDLANNQIENIPSNLFKGLQPNPTRFALLLGNNSIRTIEHGAFIGMSLSALALQANKLRDDSFREGIFSGSSISRIRLASHSLTRFNGEWFRGIAELENVRLNSPLVKRIEKGLAKHMKEVTSLHLTMKELSLENGALFGLSTKEEVTIILGRGTIVKVIEGGLFENL